MSNENEEKEREIFKEKEKDLKKLYRVYKTVCEMMEDRGTYIYKN